jgi:hypothetical protein
VRQALAAQFGVQKDDEAITEEFQVIDLDSLARAGYTTRRRLKAARIEDLVQCGLLPAQAVFITNYGGAQCPWDPTTLVDGKLNL